MRDGDFRQLVDREFAPLEWTDEQRLATLKHLNKEEHPVMKRKIIIALALAISIMVMSTAAVAVTVGIPTMQQLIDQAHNHWPGYTPEPFNVNAEAVIMPGNQRHSSCLVDIEVCEAYLTSEALYLTVYVAPKSNDAFLWKDGVPPVQDGQELRYFDLYRQENVPLLEFNGMTLHSAYTYDDFALSADYIETYRTPDDTGITFLFAYPLPKDRQGKTLFLSGCTVLGKFYVKDCRSRKDELNVILFDLPSMTIVESEDFRIYH